MLILMLQLFRFNTEEEALAISNASQVGLAGMFIFSKIPIYLNINIQVSTVYFLGL